MRDPGWGRVLTDTAAGLRRLESIEDDPPPTRRHVVGCHDANENEERPEPKPQEAPRG